jgi:23S rRNA (adenine-N6)-dimethyltransferase
MEKWRRRQIFLAQNFLWSPGLVRRLVARSSIGTSDVVYEIGPGRGIITAELARAAAKVVAIEKDPHLVRRLRERFRGVENIEIIEHGFLQFSIRARDYKIFANIPYSMTASIVRKILSVPPVPREAYLILQHEPARKFSGRPRETLFSLLAKPFVEFQIVARLKRTDFDPVPDVDSVLLRIARRREPLLQKEDAARYREFVHYGFGRWKRHLRSAFKFVFTYKQWKRLSQDLHFPLNATPTELTFEQWLGLFKAFRQRPVITDRTAGLSKL